ECSWLVSGQAGGSLVVTALGTGSLPQVPGPFNSVDFLAIVIEPGVTGYVLFNNASVIGHADQKTMYAALNQSASAGTELYNADSMESVSRRQGDAFGDTVPLQWSTRDRT